MNNVSTISGAAISVASICHNSIYKTLTQESTSAPGLTLYCPKLTKQNKMKMSKNNVTLIQKHLCEGRPTEGFREREWKFIS